MFYARRHKLGTMPLFGDASSRMVIPGGVPIVLRGTFAFGAKGIGEHFQREEMQGLPRRVRAPSLSRAVLQRNVRRLPRFAERQRNGSIGPAGHLDPNLAGPSGERQRRQLQRTPVIAGAEVGPMD